MSNNKKLYILSGPSGVGKTSIVKMLMSRDKTVRCTTSLTTRPPRPFEINGKDYFFVSREQFQMHIENNDLLEWSNRKGHLYGTLLSEVSKAKDGYTLLVIDTSGAIQVRSKIETISVFIMPPSMSVLESRLRGRNSESESDIVDRMGMALEEINNASSYDYVLTCDDVDTCCSELGSILLKTS